MKDLYWKVLDHLGGYTNFNSPSDRGIAIGEAQNRVREMDPLELLEVISSIFEEEANEAEATIIMRTKE